MLSSQKCNVTNHGFALNMFVSSFHTLWKGPCWGSKTAKTQELRGASPPRPRPGALKRAPGPHAVRRDAPVVIGTITFAISRYFIFFFFFFFFLQWAILMPDICIPIALILDSLW